MFTFLTLVVWIGLVCLGWSSVLLYAGLTMDTHEPVWKPVRVTAALTPRERRRLRRQRTRSGDKRRWKKGMRAA